MGGQILDLLVGSCLFVGAIEIFERERNIIGQSLQKLDQFRSECAWFGRMKGENANRLGALKSGKAAAERVPVPRSARENATCADRPDSRC